MIFEIALVLALVVGMLGAVLVIATGVGLGPIVIACGVLWLIGVVVVTLVAS